MQSHILILATGGTIAGRSSSALRRDYRPGQIGIGELIDRVRPLAPQAVLEGRELAAIGSEDITPDLWQRIWTQCDAAMRADTVNGIIITHGTDTAEETALLLDLTLPTAKPVVLVGAMRAADAVGSDGLRNLVNAIRVTADADAAGRGVLLVMGDRVIAARDARKARTSGTDAFRGFPRDAVAAVTPHSLDWFGAPWAARRSARFTFPREFPEVPILHAFASMEPDLVDRIVGPQTRGVVLAGFGEGNAPRGVRDRLAELARRGLVIVRASRVDEGIVDREPEDDTAGFVAARSLGPAKARVLLQVLLANGVRDAVAVQAAFDER
ncbi:asparaginase [Porphyrobacter sp. GA68]|uniref:asparaginase n=1 Tax=Porphyrobacter sp. GA68 TaxID=2883480 RepID=UPI001D1859E5|nr:asparaginase [Porphyrobacter sp. GA68]